eukprot:c24081_g1_i1 orf=195-1256(+)
MVMRSSRAAWPPVSRILALPRGISSCPVFQSQALPATPPAVLSSSTNGKREEKRRWSAMLLFLPGIATFGLGTWQLLRRQWKIELLGRRRNRLEEEEVPLGRALEIAYSQSQPEEGKELSRDAILKSLEFRRVSCEGVYDENKSIFVGPRARSNYGLIEKGYFLVVPLLPHQDENASVQVPVLVNRGWVPCSWRDTSPMVKLEETTSEVPPERSSSSRGFWRFLWGKEHKTGKDAKPVVKTVKVVGVIRDSEHPNMFVPSNMPESRQWFYVDVPAMVRSVGLPEDTIYIEAVSEDTYSAVLNDYPVPKDPDALIHASVMPHDHLNYAVTWYTLSAATTFMARKRLQSKGLRRI